MTSNDVEHTHNQEILNSVARKPAKGFQQFGERVDKSPLFGVSSDTLRVVEINVSDIETDPNQPRKNFPEQKQRELAASIESQGLLNAVNVVRLEEEGKYRLVAGERRYRAFLLLGRETIPATIIDGEPEIVAIVENVQREQLDPIEEAQAYQRLIDNHGYNQGQIGDLVGKKRNTVSEALSLLRLSPAALELYRTSDTPLSKNALVEIAKETDEARQLELLKLAQSDDLSVQALRQLRKSPPSPISGTSKPAKVAAASARKDRIIRSLHATVKRLNQDARAEDFPAGSEALERIRELRDQLNEALDQITEVSQLEAKQEQPDGS